MSLDGQIDLDIALRRLHELAASEGDLGREYWSQVGLLLKRAAGMQAAINSLSRELETCRAERGDGMAALKGLIRRPAKPINVEDMNALTLSLDEELLAKAQALTGLTDKTGLIEQALLALIKQASVED